MVVHKYIVAENDITEDLIEGESDKLVLNECTTEFITSAKINQTVKANHRKLLKQTYTGWFHLSLTAAKLDS